MYTSTLRIENNNRTSDYSELLNRAKIHVSLRIDGRGSLSLRYTKPRMILHLTYQTCLKKKNYIKTFDHLKLLRNQSLIHRNMAMYSIIPFFGCLCESTLSGLMFLFYNLTIKFFFFLSYLELGTNDLDSNLPVEELVSLLPQACQQLISIGIKLIILGEFLHREKAEVTRLSAFPCKSLIEESSSTVGS